MKAVCILVFSYFVFNSLYAQPGSLDSTFGNGGKVITNFPGNSGARAMVIQSDGKVIVGGYSRYSNSTVVNNYDFILIRYNTNGSLDTTFDGDGIVTTAMSQFNDFINDLALQPDGKIVAAGYGEDGAGSSYTQLARYEANGKLDSTFGNNGKVITRIGINNSSQALAIQGDGKIVVGGECNFGTFYQFSLIRYLPNGSVDSSFDNDGIVTTIVGNQNSVITSIRIQADGKIVVGGNRDNGGKIEVVVARYNPNGSLDLGFGTSGRQITIVNNSRLAECRSMILQPDGKIVVVGSCDFGFLVARYNNSGTPDTGFDNDGIVTTLIGGRSFANDVAIQDNGKLVVVGFGEQSNAAFTICKYNTNGSLDTTFDFDGIVTTQVGSPNSVGTSVQVRSNRIYVAGDASFGFSQQQIALVAYQNESSPFECLSDKTPPRLNLKPATLSLNASGNATLMPSDVIASLFDNCSLDSTTFAVSPNTFTCANVFAGGAGHQAYTSNNLSGSQNFVGELGLDFRVNTPNGIIINQLGAFDHMGDGISGTQSGGIRVAIFNKITKTIVPGLDAIITGAADSYNSNFRFKNIPNVTLLPGEYVVVAKGYNEKELNGHYLLGGANFPSGDNGAGAISFLTTAYFGENLVTGFSYPTKTFNGGVTNSFLAGSFNYQTVPKFDYKAYVSNTSTGNQNFYGELGSDFRVNDPTGIIIDRLGAFDHQGNGINGSQGNGIRVAIFNKATKAIVPGLDAIIAGNGDYFQSNYRYKYINPVTLVPGDYVMVAKGYNDNELNGNFINHGSAYPFGEPGGGAISFLTTTFWGENLPGGFTYPTISANLGTSNAFLAGTFVYSPTTSSATNQVTVTVKDISGNVATGKTTVIVQDPLAACSNVPAENNTATVQQTTNAELPGTSLIVKIFPNPTTAIFTVQLSNLQGSKASIEILSQSGNRIQHKSISLGHKTATVTVPFDLNHQPAGMYFVKVFCSQEVQTGKLIVQR